VTLLPQDQIQWRARVIIVIMLPILRKADDLLTGRTTSSFSTSNLLQEVS
jgi:hypothetical protein